MRTALLCCLLVSCVAAPARADCNTEVERLRAQVAQIADPAAHARFLDLVRGVVRQMMEGDEEECRRAVEAADQAIELPAAPAPAPAAESPPAAAPLPPLRDPGPPPRLIGTAIGPTSRTAIFAGRDGAPVTVLEGEPIGGYTVLAIRPSEVDATGGGVVRTLRVGLGGDVPVPVAAEPPPPDLGHRQGSNQHLE